VSKSAKPIRVVNLIASGFYGGPERIMVGCAKAMPPGYESVFFVFGERGRGDEAVRGTEMIEAARREGFETVELRHDRPNIPAMVLEVAERLRDVKADVLCCHGYKADVIGVMAARLAGIPAVGIAHFWIASTKKMGVYMTFDWLALRRMDATVAVCDAQVEKLIDGRVRPDRIFAIRNAIEAPAAVDVPAGARAALEAYFPNPVRVIAGTAARLAVEKGIDVLVRAVEIVVRRHPDAGFVVFGDGPQRAQYEAMIAERNLGGSLVLAGFRSQAQTLFPALDILALPSRAEGLPVAILEAMSVGLPVVATAVDGIPEAVIDGQTGYLVASEDHEAFADRLMRLIESEALRREMGARGRERVLTEFTFPSQAQKYARVYDRVIARRNKQLGAEASLTQDNHIAPKHRVGLVGAGVISEYHVAAVRRIPGVELLGFYDVDAARAEKAAERFGTRTFASLEAMRESGADVVHVLTPPDFHAEMTLRALELGMHVLVEKPLATDADDCRRIVSEAEARGLKVCVNHSELYNPQVRRALEAVRAGQIGKVVSVDILRSGYYPTYEGGPLPPHYRSAGFPFRDLGIHELYIIEAFLGPIEDVHGQWASFGGDKNLAYDEWRAQVRCRDGIGQFQISYNVNPIQHLIVVQGSKGVIRIDAMRMFTGRRVWTKLPNAGDKLLGIYTDVFAPAIDFVRSGVAVVKKKILPYHGLQTLVAEFYRSLDGDAPVPVPAADAVAVVGWIEKIARGAEAEAASRAAVEPALAQDVPVVVTGAAGAVGGAIVARLLERGERVRIFVRRAPAVVPDGVEVCVGDLRNPAAVERAVRGARKVIHAGAAMSGDWTALHASTVVGTRNVVDACLKSGVEQLVHISSMSVPQWSGTSPDAPLTESSPLDPRPEARDGYARAKLEAEKVVSGAVRERGLPAVILRPGLIFGGPLPLINQSVARRIGNRFIVLGDGELRLPWVYLDDVVDAVVAALDRGLTHGEIIQIVDRDVPTQNDVLRRAANADARIVRVPRPLVFALGKLSELVLKSRSPFTAYRLHSVLARRTYRSEAASLIGWSPRIGVSRGMDLVAGPRVKATAPATEPSPRAVNGSALPRA
jgi:predicted dehydrogenase/nucleoside-diphosphate-sugar epimerase/glycosyltransferase involved in cell wall biosynthesis